MAFKDITKVLYDGKIKLDYKDRAHRYYVRERVNFDLPEDDAKAWGKIKYPKGTTTLIGDTLEKKGLMTWPMGLALGELFGFYDFNGSDGERRTGFSKDKGTLWDDGHLLPVDQETALPLLLSASKAWSRKQKKGADIGTVVHDAIEHFIKGQEFDIGEQYLWSIKEALPLPNQGEEDKFEVERNLAFDEYESDVACATKAFLQFQKWWLLIEPKLHGAEDLLYSMKFNVCGTYDADLSIPGKHHPVFKDKEFVRCTTDWKTSNASASKEAAMPEGVNYQYFVQDAIYEMMRREMGMEPADDLLVVSARKDGGFSLVYASELGLSVQECIDWAEATILCYRLAEKSKAGLLAHAQPALKEGEF
jgi:hypothetical protein